MVARQLGAGADEDRLRAAADLDGVVGHQPVPAHDQIERALALADAALPGDQDAKAEHVDEHGVDGGPLGQRVLEQRAQLRDRRRRRQCRPQERQGGALRLHDELARRRQASGDDHTGQVVAEREPRRRRPGGRIEPPEVANLALAEDEHSAVLEVLVKPGQRQTGLLHVRAGDRAPQAVGAGDEVEREAERLETALEEGPHAHTRRGGHSVDFGLDERQLAGRAAKQHAQRRRLDVAEHNDRVRAGVHLPRRVGDRQGEHRLPGGPQYLRPVRLDLHGRHGNGRRGRRRSIRRRRGPAAAPLPLLPLALDRLGLPGELVDRLRRRGLPARRAADAVQELLAARVQGDVRAPAVFLARQHHLRRHGSVVQHTFEPGELPVHEAAQGGSDVDVTTCQFQSHGIRVGPLSDTTLFAGWMSKSSNGQ